MKSHDQLKMLCAMQAAAVCTVHVGAVYIYVIRMRDATLTFDSQTAAAL